MHPGPGLRETPLHGVLLTDAELDHTLGLLILREGARHRLYGTATVQRALRERFPVLPILGHYAEAAWETVRPGEVFVLPGVAAGSGIDVYPFLLSQHAPRYVGDLEVGGHWVIGYRFRDRRTGGTAVYAPGVEAWTEGFASAVDGADCVLMDGTFWSDDELIALGGSDRTARQMGHLPIAGDDGSAWRLAQAAARRKVYVHINNTNPILQEGSPERAYLTERGIEVGWDGMEIEV